ncbi:hypothetical protein SAMN02787076_05291 [Rhizobacter sp. OV335]|nr:hypothetical protein SAMN02787076_05291 [Rhizobacter sp. OV335]
MCAFAFRMAPNRLDLVKHDVARHQMLMGAAPALQPLLAKVGSCSGPMPWGPSSDRLTEYMDNYLWRCGTLHSLHRLASLERYGLSRTKFEGERRLTIEIEHGRAEAADRHAELWLIAQQLKTTGALAPLSAAQLKRIRRRLDERSSTDLGGWFIRYSFDEALMERGLQRIRQLEAWWPEATALADDAMVGGRTFRQWKDACRLVAAQALSHLEFCTRLVSTHRHLDLRNLLTLYRTRGDIAHGWHANGYEPVWADMATRSMTLDGESNPGWLSHYDTPFPFYVDLGPDFALVPSMSALLNPFVGMVRHLRGHYRRDWDTAVDAREDRLRKELAALFPGPRYEVAPSGFKLKRQDGSVLTDIDAAIVDHLHGTVALVQIKWYDVSSRSLRERDSRRRNMLGAGTWVDRVHGWVANRDSGTVMAALGIRNLSAKSSGPPVLIVMTRHAARFSGEASADRRSAWVSWPEFARTVHGCLSSADVLRIVAARHAPTESSPVDASLAQQISKTLYSFDGVEIEVFIRES